MRQVKGMLITLALLHLALSSCLAEEYLWDQTNDLFSSSGCLSVQAFSPVGQEFSPILNCLEVVQLEITNIMDDAEFIVNIHSESITGPVIGTSSTVTISGYFSGIVTFIFDPLPLQPQSLYVFEIVQTVGTEGGIGNGTNYSSYPLGCKILHGNPYENSDFWFREGIIEVTAMHRLTWAAVKSCCW